MYYDKVMFSINGNDMDLLLRLKFVSECFMFCFSGCCFLLQHILRSFEMFNQDFRRSQHSTGNWKSVISIGMSEGGHEKGWAWFKLTTREKKRSDKTKYE